VLNVLFLLRKEANSPGLTGGYDRYLPNGSLVNRYNYRVMRLWQEDPDLYLTGGVNLVPLAPLTNVSETDVPALVRRMNERIRPEPEPRADWLWLATYVLMGWRYDVKQAAQWLNGVWNMDKSPSYQAILRDGRNEGLIEGRVAEAQRLLLMLGGNRFGEPDEATRGAVEAIHDVDRLERMTVRVYDEDIADWEGLLNTA
jgi:predicted transposase YdaD